MTLREQRRTYNYARQKSKKTQDKDISYLWNCLIIVNTLFYEALR